MNSLYESILAGRKASVDQGVKMTKLEAIHNHNEGIGKIIEFVDVGENAVRLEGDSLYFSNQVNITQSVNLRKQLGISDITAPKLLIYPKEDKLFDVEESFGHLHCQELQFKQLAHGLKNLHVTFRGLGDHCTIPNNWGRGMRTNVRAAGCCFIDGYYVKSDEKLVLENCTFENESSQKCKDIYFYNCCPEFRNVQLDDYKIMCIFLESYNLEEKYSIGQAIMSLIDRSYTFKCLHKMKEVEKNCRTLRSIRAFFNNFNNYTPMDAPYRILPDAKISDIWDLSKSSIREIWIFESGIQIGIVNNLEKAKSLFKYAYPSIAETHFKTADGWYVVFNKK